MATALHMMTAHLRLPAVPTVVCTNSQSLYECLVKLGMTKEKKLVIDVLALRQSYEREEPQEVWCIHGVDNLAGEAPGDPHYSSAAIPDRGCVVQDTLLQVPLILRDGVDPETWGKLSQYDKLSSPTQEQTTGHIGYLTVVWEQGRVVGRDLWNAFTQQLGEWSQDQWNETAGQIQIYLRQFLIDNGVYVETRTGLRIATAWYNVATT
jgi:hypothetical protein